MKRIANWAASVGVAGLFLVCAVTLFDALARSFFGSPLYGLSDVLELTTPAIVASCFPLALLNKQNITIRFLGRALPGRLGLSVELFGQLAALIVLTGICIELASYTVGLVKANQVTWLLRMPIWPTWILSTALIAVCVPIQFITVLESLRQVRRGEPLMDSRTEIEHEIAREG